MKTLTLVAISILGLVRCNAEENKSETSLTPAAQEFLQTLPENKRLMLSKFEKEQKEKVSEMLKTQKIPKPDNNQYEKQFYFSRDFQLFYVKEILLSEDGEAVGFFFAELSLDKNGDWIIGPMQKTVAFLEDLQKETAPRFKLHKTKENGYFIEPPENIKSVPPSRLMRELFAEEAGRKSATESLQMKLKQKKDEKSSAHPHPNGRADGPSGTRPAIPGIGIRPG